MDEQLYATVFVPGASLNYGEYFTGTAEEFRVWVWSAHEGMQAHSHQITNILIDVGPNNHQAASEAYVTVCLRTKPDEHGNIRDVVDRGRYLDRWALGDDNTWKSRTAAIAATSSNWCTPQSRPLSLCVATAPTLRSSCSVRSERRFSTMAVVECGLVALSRMRGAAIPRSLTPTGVAAVDVQVECAIDASSGRSHQLRHGVV
jgi:hypothetical protein